MNRRDAIRAVLATPAIAAVSVARLAPDDVIVVECDRPLSLETLELVRAQLAAVWPGRKILVVGPELRLKVLQAT